MMNRNESVVGPSDSELAELLIEKMTPNLRYGASFLTADLRDTVGLSEDSKAANIRWMSVCRIMKDTLMEDRQMYLRSVGSGSYTIVLPEEQAMIASEDATRTILDGLNKANRVIDHTNTDRLTPDQLRRHDDFAADHAARAQLFRRELRRRKRWKER